ncbi:MAG: magnesium/cobalt transporter CorA [Thermoanaerobaculia bacterium]|nr:magnesium/cobalt transporter CorA [Thermoanaerobaculia bacterium]
MSRRGKRLRLGSLPGRSLLSRAKRPGTAPGTLEPPPERRVEEVAIQVMDFGAETLDEKTVEGVEELLPYRDSDSVTWIHVVGLHDVELLRGLGEAFGLHPLALEDVLHTVQRPKLDVYEDHLFLVLKRLEVREEELQSDQVSLFLTRGCVLTFHETKGDDFDAVRERIRKGNRIRSSGADYLAYALVDALVDAFFPILERFGERIEALEDELIEEPTEETLERIHGIRRDLLTLRRSVWPQREVLTAFERQEPPLVRESTRVYLRDCYDHAVQILDLTETYRDLATGMLDVYLSRVSNRMNEVMKVLTVMASLFIPLTFIAGVYGMNFQHMPELGLEWGYPAVWGLMIAVAAGLLWFFKRKGWL